MADKIAMKRSKTASAWLQRGGVVLFALLTVEAGLLTCLAMAHSPTPDEMAYLPAGISNWRFARFELYRANPPLVRMVAALPALLLGCETDWSKFDSSTGVRSDFAVGADFLAANGDRSFWLFTAARWACAPFVLLGGMICWRWADDLYGLGPAVAATTLWCLCPNILGHGALITPDVPATALGLAGSYAFWKWLQAPSWQAALIVGLALGTVELAKGHWLILYAVWPVLWLGWHLTNFKHQPGKSIRIELLQLCSAFALSVLVINIGYGFDGSFKRLKDISFQSTMFHRRQTAEPESADRKGGDRFAESWMGHLRVPLPEQYVLGIDTQKRGFGQGRPAYLFGQWQHGGWWYYYLAAGLVKIPAGTLLLMMLAAFARIRLGISAEQWRKEAVLLMPALGLIAIVSINGGINRHFRYAIPALPFLFIWASSVFESPLFRHRVVSAIGLIALACSTISSLSVYPHSLSYFNEFAGGPKGGPRFLLDSNTDWGQDMLFLRQWIDKHTESRPLTVGWHITYLDTRIAGISFPRPPLCPTPGWHIVSVNEIYAQDERYRYFLDFQPVDRVAYSMNVYHLKEEDIEERQRRITERREKAREGDVR